MVNIKFINKLVVVLLVMFIFASVCVTNLSYATDYGTNPNLPRMADPTSNPDNYNPSVSDSTVGKKIIAMIVKWLRGIAVVIGVLAITIIGFNYMLAGAAEEKAKYKETLIPVVIGAILAFGILTIIGTVMGLF